MDIDKQRDIMELCFYLIAPHFATKGNINWFINKLLKVHGIRQDTFKQYCEARRRLK